MFTLVDIRNIAIQIEQNGEASYRHAAQNTNHSEIAKLFEMMAADEQKHAQWFERMAVAEKTIAKDAQIEEMGRELLQGMMAQQTFSLQRERLAAAVDVLDALRQSIEFENDTVLFYEMLHSFLDDSDTMRQIELIIEEERSHIAKLYEIIRMVESERQSTR